MAQCSFVLSFEDVRDRTHENFRLEQLSSVATVLAHTTVCLHPLIEPLLHYWVHFDPVVVLFRLAEFLLVPQLGLLEVLNLCCIIFLQFFDLILVRMIRTPFLDHPLHDWLVHWMLRLMEPWKAFLIFGQWVHGRLVKMVLMARNEIPEPHVKTANMHWVVKIVWSKYFIHLLLG